MRIVVLGAGPNGLVAATLAQRAGHQVSLVDPGLVAGGAAAGGSFDGHAHTGILHDTHHIRRSIVKQLGLELQFQPVPAPCAPDGTPLVLPTTLAGLIEPIRGLVASVVENAPPEVGAEAKLWPLMQRALDVRRLGRARMMELLRVGPSSILDLAADHTDDPVQQGLLCWDALMGTWMGPVSPTSTATWLLRQAMAGDEVVGGPAAVVEALLAVAPAPQLGAALGRIVVQSGRVTGVEVGSEVLAADAVISTLGPRETLLERVHPMHLSPLIERDLLNVRVRGIMAKVHFATSSPLFGTPRVRTAVHPLDLERAFDHAKHRRIPTDPGLEVRQVGDVASVLVYGASAELDGGWTDAARHALGEAVRATLRRHVPDLDSRVGAHEVLTPADLEGRLGCQGGHLSHGELALDQMWVMRPTMLLAGGDTGISGLFLGSDGMHPGVPLTLAPGWLAARRALG